MPRLTTPITLLVALLGCLPPGPPGPRGGPTTPHNAPSHHAHRPPMPEGRHPGPCKRTMTGARAEIVTFTYNDKGDLVEELWDTDGDGTTDYRVTFTRGDRGQPIERTRDEGTPDTTYQRTRFTHDDRGLPTEQTTTYADGTQIRTRTQYDDLLRPTTTHIHALPSNQLLSRTTRQYQPTLIVQLQDVDGDGQDDERATIYLNDRGQPIRRLDGGTTGDPEVETLSTYDARGLLTRLEVKGLERQPTRTEFFIYDSGGNLTDHAIDADFDLIPETRYTHTYDCW